MLRVSMHEVIIEKALHWVVRVLRVVDTTEREVSAYEGEVKWIQKGHKGDGPLMIRRRTTRIMEYGVHPSHQTS